MSNIQTILLFLHAIFCFHLTDCASILRVKNKISPTQQEMFIPYAFSKAKSEDQRRDQLRLQLSLDEVSKYQHPSPLVHGFAYSKFAQETENFTQESWNSLARRPLLVALVFTRSSNTNKLLPNIYRAHDFNQWLIEPSEYETRDFRVDPLTHEKLLSKNIYYFTLTHNSLMYLCSLRELVNRNARGQVLREHFLENADDDIFDTWYAHGINLIRIREDGTIQELQTVPFFIEQPVRAIQITPERMKDLLWEDTNAIANALERNVQEQEKHACSPALRAWYSTIWPNYKKRFTEFTHLQDSAHHHLPTNQFQKAVEYSRLHFETLYVYECYRNRGGISVGNQPAQVRQIYHFDAITNMSEGSQLKAFALCVVAPLALAFVHGLINNLLARQAHCLVLARRFYQAPPREWITGTLVLIALSLLSKEVHHLINNKCKKMPAQPVWLINYIITLINMGFVQEVGEKIPLSKHGVWRTDPIPHTELDIWLRGNICLAISTQFFRLEALISRACHAS